MKKNSLPSQTLSSSALMERSSFPLILSVLLHVAVTIFTRFTFASWSPIIWALFIPYYLLLWIASIFYLRHWHKKMLIQEEASREKLKAILKAYQTERKKEAQAQLMEKQSQLDQKAILSQIIEKEGMVFISIGESPILGKDVVIFIDPSTSSSAKNHTGTKRNK